AEMKNELAVVCCRTEEGTVIEAEHLEDPSIFPDLVDSGLLTIPDNCLKIGEVIGATVTETIDSLSPLTPDIVEGAKELVSEDVESVNKDEKAVLKFNKNQGDIIELEDLENPMHFDKLSDSLLIDLDENVLSIKEVLGEKLNQDVEALTPITPNLLEGYEDEIVSKDGSLSAVSNGWELKIKI